MNPARYTGEGSRRVNGRIVEVLGFIPVHHLTPSDRLNPPLPVATKGGGAEVASPGGAL